MNRERIVRASCRDWQLALLLIRHCTPQARSLAECIRTLLGHAPRFQ